MLWTIQLRRTLHEVFEPHVRSKGFVVDRSEEPQFTTWRRSVDDQVQVFDLQWDRWGRPRFVVNFADVRVGDRLVRGRRIDARSIHTYDCEGALRLQARRVAGMPGWFQLRKPLREQLRTGERDYTPDQVVQQLMEAFGEVEIWWNSRQQGPHVVALG